MKYPTLADYPRPKPFTRVGFHWNGSDFPVASEIEPHLSWWKERGVSMATLFCANDAGVQAAALCAQNGIMPMIRLTGMGKPHPNYVPDAYTVGLYVRAGARYFVAGNEPNLQGESDALVTSPDYLDRVMQQWARSSAVIKQAGGVPMLYPLSPGGDVFHDKMYLRMFAWLKAHGDTLEDCAIASHPRPLNHPMSYPYDPINQAEHPGATLDTDSVCFLVVNWLDEQVKKLTGGRQIPIIATEHGSEPGDDQDGRYPVQSHDRHASFNVDEMLAAYRTGVIPNPPGQAIPLTDAFFGGCSWLENETGRSIFANASWLSNALYGGKNLPAWDRLKAVWQAQPYEVKWHGGDVPPAPPAPPVVLRTWSTETLPIRIIQVITMTGPVQIALDTNVFEAATPNKSFGFEFAGLGDGVWTVRVPGMATATVRIGSNLGARLTPNPDPLPPPPPVPPAPPPQPKYTFALGFADYAKAHAQLKIVANGPLEYTGECGDAIQRALVDGKRGFLLWDKGNGGITHVVTGG